MATTAQPLDAVKSMPALTRADAARKAEHDLMERSRENEAQLYEKRGARRGDAKLKISDALQFTETACIGRMRSFAQSKTTQLHRCVCKRYPTR